MPPIKSLGVYVHVPFCKKKCHYCDFYSVCDQSKIEEYVRAVKAHIDENAFTNMSYEVDSIYFGGGTPTVLGAKNLYKIYNQLLGSFKVLNHAEVTLEANPESVDLPMLKKLRKHGFNRISIGLQSSSNYELMALGRLHTFEQGANAVAMAKKAGFKNISLDLMYGLPNQTYETFKQTIEDIAALEPQHISAYALKLEEGTHLHSVFNDKIDDELQADMYFYLITRLAELGYEQYEISNFALPGYHSRHNSKYWDLSDYLAFGPSAHSFVNNRRFSYISNLDQYIKKIDSDEPLADQIDDILPSERAGEYLMLRLRTTKGIDSAEFERRFFTKFDLIEDALQRYIAHNYAVQEGTRFKLTPKGFFVSNAIISELLLVLEKSEKLGAQYYNKDFKRKKWY